MLDFLISIPGYILKWCNNLVGNQYLLALLLFALIVEIALLPLGISQQRKSRKQAKLRPKEMAIRKKYNGRDDQQSKQKMSLEIQEMYQKEGFNPMSGCLPMLIQLPIIIALYNIVMNPLKYICNLSTDAINGVMKVVEGYTSKTTYTVARNIDLMSDMRKIIETEGVEAFASVEGFSEHISGLSDIPNLTIFGGAIDLGATPSFSEFGWLLLVPVLTFVAYFFSTKINRKLMYQPAQDDAAMGCSNKVMDISMPLLSVFITFGVPAALGVYWIFKCVLGVLKQFLLSLIMPIPKLTEEEMLAAEKEYNAKAAKNPSRTGNNGKVRSLHHIDDEDYEDITPAPKKAEPEKAETVEEDSAEKKEDAPSDKANNLLGHAELKEDKPNEDMSTYRKGLFKRKKDDKEK